MITLTRESPVMTTFRSLILVVLLAILGGGTTRASPDPQAGYYADQKVVYHNGGSVPDPTAYSRRLLGNLRNDV